MSELLPYQDMALITISRAHTEAEGRPLKELARDPMFDRLHADARIAALVQRIGIHGRKLPDSGLNAAATQ